MKNIRWAVIGLGRFGKIHAAVIDAATGASLQAICNRNGRKLAEAQQDYPGAIAVTDYRRLLDSHDIDVVSITTHWREHFQIAKQALLAGKHIFVEKPMAATGEECRELTKLAEKSQCHLMAGHICRFDPRIAMAQEAIAAGRIGNIVSMHAKRNLPRAPGNIRLDKISPLMGDGIHDADLMLWFMRELPLRVYARNIRFSGHEYPDLGWAMLEFGTHAVGVIETIWCLPETVRTVIDARLDIVGTEGTITIDCSETGFELTDGSGPKMGDTVYWPRIHGHHVGALAHELNYFTDCIRHDREPTIITPQEAANAVLVMECAERSAAIGEPVVVPKTDSADR